MLHFHDRVRKEIFMKKFFKNLNYRKYAKLATGIHLACYAIDMTLGYVLVRKYLKNSGDEKDKN